MAWGAVQDITTSGAGKLTATNSFDMGGNTLANGGTITAPAVGGSGGAIIGG